MSDSEGSEGSEGSDHIGYLVEPDHNPEPDEGDESDASASAASDSGTDGSRINPFDLEAADSDDDRSGFEEGGTGCPGLDLSSDDGDHFFPQFQRLPYELRHRVWAFFCPELTAKSCVYWLHLHQRPNKNDGARGVVVASEGPFLEQQTRPARAMLAVHHESRQLALKSFPDTLPFGSDGVLRLKLARDVVFLGFIDAVMLDLEAIPPLPGLSEHIRHLAVDPAVLHDRSSALFEAFENLKTVYYATSPTEHRQRHLRWCTSDLVKRYSLTTFEEQSGLGEDGHHVYCWPDLENHREFAEAQIPLEALAEDLLGDGIDIKRASFGGVAIWPMVQFFWEGFDHINDLLLGDGEGDVDWDTSDREDDGEPDEYESEGIDDSYISDGSLDSDPRDDLAVLEDEGSDQGSEGSEDSSSSASGSLPRSARDGVIDVTGDDHGSIAAFSSPEQSSATLQGSGEPAEDSEQPAPRVSRLKRPRRRVVESEDEGDSNDDFPRKRARAASPKIPTIWSRAEEEDGLRKTPAGRRARRVLSEDEDDEEQGDGVNAHTSDARGEEADWSGLSSSDEGDEESEGGAAVAKPLSLAERLQLHRQQNPVPLSDGEESEMEEMGGDDYDAGEYADFQDDEEGNGDPDSGRDDDHVFEDDEEDYGY